MPGTELNMIKCSRDGGGGGGGYALLCFLPFTNDEPQLSAAQPNGIQLLVAEPMLEPRSL